MQQYIKINVYIKDSFYISIFNSECEKFKIFVPFD